MPTSAVTPNTARTFALANGIATLYATSGTTMNGHQSGWTFVNAAGTRFGRRVTPSKGSKAVAAPFGSFRAAADAAANKGVTGGWCRAGASGVWVPEGTKIPGVKMSAPGTACTESSSKDYATTPCNQFAPDGVLCVRHAKLTANRAARTTAWQTKWEATDAAHERAEETRRSATETLERLASSLDRLGLRSDQVAVCDVGTHDAPRIAVSLPAEVLEALVVLAVQADELSSM